MNKKPYLSIVVSARNDNHGDNFINRMQAFINGLQYHAKRVSLHIELIVVEWNPPEAQKFLRDALTVKDFDLFDMVFIEVSKELHSKFKHSKSLPLYQMIAKNVGIRRSRGEFVLATNVDLLFSNEIFDFIASKKLSKNIMYRAIRKDVDDSVLNYAGNITDNELIKKCEEYLIRINDTYQTKNLRTEHSNMIYIPDTIASAGGWFELSMPKLFTNASGDFQLMHIDNWGELQGYYEIDAYSMHLDSLLEFSAYFNGIKEVVLESSMCSYHIEHGNGFTPESEKDGSFDKRYEKVKKLDYNEIIAYAKVMRTLNRSISFNKEEWGLGIDILPAYIYKKDRYKKIEQKIVESKLSDKKINYEELNYEIICKMDNQHIQENIDEIYYYAKLLYSQKNYKKAYDLFMITTIFNYADGMLNSAFMIYNGIGVKENISEAVFWLNEASNLDNIEGDNFFSISSSIDVDDNSYSSFTKGLFYLFGFCGIKKNHNKALEMFQIATRNRENLFDPMFLVTYKGKFRFEKKIYDKIDNWLLSMAKERIDLFIISYITFHLDRVISLDNDIELESLLEFDLKKEYPKLYNYIGVKYLLGDSVNVNYEKAYNYFKKGVDYNNNYSANNLGTIYLEGLGKKQSYEKAFKWYNKAVSLGGSIQALNNLANLYYNGLGTEKNIQKARELFSKAKKNGLYVDSKLFDGEK